MNQKWSKGKCQYECKSLIKHNACRKGYIWNPSTSCCENGRYAGSIISDSVITCDEIVDAERSDTLQSETSPTRAKS